MSIDHTSGIGGYIEITSEKTTRTVIVTECPFEHKNQNGTFCSKCGERLIDIPTQEPFDVDAISVYYEWREEFEDNDTVKLNDVWFAPEYFGLIIHQPSSHYLDEDGDYCEVNAEILVTREKFFNNPELKQMTDFLDKLNIKYKVGFGIFTYMS